MTKFWLDKFIRRSRIPYPIFFIAVSYFLYLIGIPLMISTDNLRSFLSEPRWVLLANYGIVAGICVIFIFRKFSRSLNNIRHLISSEDEFKQLTNRLLGYLTNKVYWISVAFWIIINLLRLLYFFGVTSVAILDWWEFYNQPFLVTIYYLIEGLPTNLFGGIFLYMVPFGLTLAYRDLCLKTTFNEDVLVYEWMEPFKDFKNLITFTMFIAVFHSPWPLIIWAPTLELNATNYIPYASIVLFLVPTVIFPHYFFHKLFSNVKENRVKYIRRELLRIRDGRKKDSIRNIRLLLEKWETERVKTWLFDVKILGEVIVVALMHLILIEVLTTILH